MIQSYSKEAFLQREKMLRPRRLPLLVMMSATKAPFSLPEQAFLPYSLDELLAHIRINYQNEIQDNGIEMREEQKTSIG